MEFIINELNETEKEKLRGQLKFLTHKKRIKYPKSFVSEFYPEKHVEIPQENLFSRTEEFKLASLKVKSDKTDYNCQSFMVLGSLFDISIKPIPTDSDLNSSELILEDIKIEQELNKNMN